MFHGISMLIPTLSFMYLSVWFLSLRNPTSKSRSTSSKYTDSWGQTVSKYRIRLIVGSMITTNGLLFKGRKTNGKKLILSLKVGVSFVPLRLLSTTTWMLVILIFTGNPYTWIKKTKWKYFISIDYLRVLSTKSITFSTSLFPEQLCWQLSQQFSRKSKLFLPHTTKIQMWCWWKLYFPLSFPWSGIIFTYQTYQ